MSKAEMKKKFEAYYAELKAEAKKADGYKVNMGFDLDLTGFSTDEIEALLAP